MSFFRLTGMARRMRVCASTVEISDSTNKQTNKQIQEGGCILIKEVCICCIIINIRDLRSSGILRSVDW